MKSNINSETTLQSVSNRSSSRTSQTINNIRKHCKKNIDPNVRRTYSFSSDENIDTPVIRKVNDSNKNQSTRNSSHTACPLNKDYNSFTIIPIIGKFHNIICNHHGIFEYCINSPIINGINT